MQMSQILSNNQNNIKNNKPLSRLMLISKSCT